MPRPSITVLEDYEALSRAGADVVAQVVATNPRGRVVVATGRTPMGLYRELASRAAGGEFDATGLTIFQLDEYVDIPTDDRRSLLGWAIDSFAEPLGIPRERVVPLPVDGDAGACAAYDREVEDGGGYDLTILGIGPNGHVGFNEPPSDADTPTRLVELSPESVRSNAGYWGGESHVPRQAVTVGMAGLLRSRTILLVASGSSKRDIVRRAVLGPQTPDVPASLLQGAADLRVLLDRAAWDGSEPVRGGVT